MQWQNRLPDPWNQYRLVVTQWTGKDGHPEPRNENGVSIARNAALETFLLGDEAVAREVPGIDTANTCPTGAGIGAAQKALEEGKPLPQDATTLEAIIATDILKKGKTTTYSSCMLCHQPALFHYADGNKTVSTDYSFIFRTFIKQDFKCD